MQGGDEVGPTKKGQISHFTPINSPKVRPVIIIYS